MRTRLIRAACLLGLLVAALPAPLRAEEPTANAWESPGLLAQALDAAIAAVEEVAGARFEARPTARHSTAADVRGLLETELAEALAAQGDALRQGLGTISEGLVAKYAPDTLVVHVVPATMARLAEILREPLLLEADVLRVVLAHEVAHALDFQRFPALDRRRRELATRPVAATAAGAVIEGHAQWVAARVARRWGLEEAFRRFTHAITAVPEGLEPAQALILRAIVAEAAFAYGKGQAFCEAVHDAQGREGLERALADPPLTPEEIERPELWLDPKRAPAAADLGAHLDACAALAPGEGWEVTKQSLLRAHIEAQAVLLPESERAAATTGYEGGRAGVWQRESPPGFVAAGVMRFDGPENTKRWIATERAIFEAKDEQMAQGELRVVSSTYAAIEGVPLELGFRVVKRVKVPGLGEKDYAGFVLAVGSLSYEVTVFDPDEAQRAALASLPATLGALPPPR
jgi:hypothetical protein